MPTRLGHSLRTRLVLAFMALVSLILVVGLGALSSNQKVQHEVADLQAGIGTDLARLDLSTLGLEIKGRWDPTGTFLAREVEVYPGVRRPKLRGPIQAVDSEGGSFTLYGQIIHVVETTQFPLSAAGQTKAAELQPGIRVEVTCDVDGEGTWAAREIWTREVKDSDKIKGTATAWDIDGIIPESLDIHGLHVTLALRSDLAPDSALRRIEIATQLMLALHDCRAVAHELVGRSAPEEESDASSQLDRDVLLPTSVTERLQRVAADFSYYVEQAADTGAVANESLESSARWVGRLAALVPKLDAHVNRLLRLASTPYKARRYMNDVLDPYLMAELQPVVHAYMNHSQEELSDQLERLVARSDDTTRFALGMTVVAAVAAIILAFLIWRSISRPIQALHKAARRLAQGRLDTRVILPQQDEFGDLASAFNLMASELARSTVSIGDLENVFDSMAGALVILDASGCIVRTNHATQQLVQRGSTELVGVPFADICRSENGESWRPATTPGSDGGGTILEREFVCADGTTVPVSLAGAPLRFSEGTADGFVCVAQDLTERKLIEERLRQSVGEKELLLREVHHRVKNNMQVISSLLEMQADTVGNADLAGPFAESQNRVRSMSLIHEQLYQSADLANIDVRTYIEVLTSQLAHSFGDARKVEIELEVEDLDLDIDQSLSCGLIINELVVNAYKHAFPDEQSGSIRVSLVRDEEGGALLSVSDDGRGLVETLKSSSRQGLGTSLIRMLVKQLRGPMSVDGADGADVRIHFPLHALTARAEL
jgi:PAS domain S-box-containing protein